MTTPTPTSIEDRNVLIVHLASGSVVIGHTPEPSAEGHPALFLHNPYELMVTPHPTALQSQITLIPYGSLYGALLDAAPKVLALSRMHYVALVPELPLDLVREYKIAVSRTQAERDKIRATLEGATTDVTNGGVQ